MSDMLTGMIMKHPPTSFQHFFNSRKDRRHLLREATLVYASPFPESGHFDKIVARIDLPAMSHLIPKHDYFKHSTRSLLTDYEKQQTIDAIERATKYLNRMSSVDGFNFTPPQEPRLRLAKMACHDGLFESSDLLNKRLTLATACVQTFSTISS